MARKAIGRMRAAIVGLIIGFTAYADVVSDVRAATAAGDFAGAEKVVLQHRKASGATPANILAQSWIARGALAAKLCDQAEKYAAETRRLVATQLKTRKLDAEPDLPTALGAAIEVTGQCTAAAGERDQAVAYLKTEMAQYAGTSIIARLQKNVNLLSLEGKPLPRLDKVAPSMTARKPVLIFLWAHWCGDCKSMAGTIARLKSEHPSLAILAPTQTYGYAEGGREVGQQEEIAYIDSTWRGFYPNLGAVPTPVSKLNFERFGASTTPTIVLADKAGIVRLYHPGRMSYDELAPLVRRLANP